MDEGRPVSYEALPVGAVVLSSTDTQFGSRRARSADTRARSLRWHHGKDQAWFALRRP